MVQTKDVLPAQSPPPEVVGPDGELHWRIHGVDYDLETFVLEHPGGELAIRLAAGIDSTYLFESYHPGKHRAAAYRVLKRHRVMAPKYPTEVSDTGGEMMASASEVVRPQLSAFKRDLDLMVEAYFAGRGRSAHKASYAHLSCVAPLMVLQLACWVGWYQGSLWALLLLPTVFYLCAVNIAHDASHFAISARPWLNRLAACAACPLICDSITWYGQHVVTHHCHVNDVDKDCDLQHFAPLKVHVADTRVHPAGDSTRLDLLKLSGFI